MKRVFVTGSKGFLGRNLCSILRQREDLEVAEHDRHHSIEANKEGLLRADVVIHLAGVNRAQRVEEFEEGNAGATAELLGLLQSRGRAPKVLFSSSIQAASESPYGRSKLAAEEELRRYCERTGAEGVAYRLKNLFGKWSRPNYNSVVATLCHNIARDLPIQISDPDKVIDLTYVDDVVAAFMSEAIRAAQGGFRFADPLSSHAISLGDLATTLRGFREHRTTLALPDFAAPFSRALYATYLSYVPPEQCSYALGIREDARGSLAEFIKGPHFGQIFLSRTKPGVTRGNHYHQTKAEKFMVVQGEGIIRLRQIHGDQVVEFRVKGEEYRVVDIPPGYTHSIENVGAVEMVTLFWSCEVFDPGRPDTRFDPVLSG